MLHQEGATNMTNENLSVLITGASKGLGRALAEELAGQGARVVLVARGREEVERAAREIRASGGEAHALAYDVADKEAAHKIAGAAAALVGPIDVLVHNASTLGPVPMPMLLDTACEDLAAVLETNLVGPFRLTKIVAGSMLLRERGTVLFVSSDAAVEAYAGWGAYSVSKAAADHLARVFAAELPSVRFVSIDPGEMDTEMHAAALPDADRATLARPADVARRIASLVRRADVPSGSRIAASALARDGRAA
jgi:NAD(P)-dependent dehydrogenase (short-subunit alcohol dehydrogenase family)